MSPSLPRDGAGALAGVAAGTTAVAIATLGAAVVPGAPAPLPAVGQLVIHTAPLSWTQWTIAVFGAGDKAALTVLLIAAGAALAALLGVLIAREHRVAARLGRSPRRASVPLTPERLRSR